MKPNSKQNIPGCFTGHHKTKQPEVFHKTTAKQNTPMGVCKALSK